MKDSETLREEMQILKAASLSDKEAPENLCTERARNFVSRTLGAVEDEERKESILDRIAAFLKGPSRAYAYGGVAFALCACVALAVILFKPAGDPQMHQIMQGQSSIHAAVDSADVAAADSTAAVQDSLEICVIDE